MVVDVLAGDSFYTKTSLVIVSSLNANPVLPEGFNKEGKLMVAVNLTVKDVNGKAYAAQPVFVIDLENSNSVSSIPAEIKEQGMSTDILKIDPNNKKITLSIKETEKPTDFIIMKAIVFPYINLVWLGGIITFLGAFISMWRRMKENK